MPRRPKIPQDPHQHKPTVANSLPVGVEGGVGEALALVVPEELAVTQTDVVDLVARTTPVQPLPLFTRHLAFPAHNMLLKAPSFLSQNYGDYYQVAEKEEEKEEEEDVMTMRTTGSGRKRRR